ncbi:Protein of unknown function [Pyronema omphalodes CBS 100304]|uniref:Uncharacterized protein n=1 Tax=Pyronema omphalodes (strain CBS 100304) TaxID=1076935 RepID=U4L873_PYROM|nr:Protein of unknown function [Pyronema omphalodes CBS 100304]
MSPDATLSKTSAIAKFEPTTTSQFNFPCTTFGGGTSHVSRNAMLKFLERDGDPTN